MQLPREMEEEEERDYEDTALIPISVLTNLLTCSICRDLMDSSHVGMTCMHRFCGPCIERYITSTATNDRSCPFCRCKIASRRQFKAESFCPEIIDILFTYAPQNSSEQFKLSEFKELHRTRSAEIFAHSKVVSKDYVYVPVEPVLSPRKEKRPQITPEVEDDMINLGLRYCVSGLFFFSFHSLLDD
jgi:hypothetical protein